MRKCTMVKCNIAQSIITIVIINCAILYFLSLYFDDLFHHYSNDYKSLSRDKTAQIQIYYRHHVVMNSEVNASECESKFKNMFFVLLLYLFMRSAFSYYRSLFMREKMSIRVNEFKLYFYRLSVGLTTIVAMQQ